MLPATDMSLINRASYFYSGGLLLCFVFCYSIKTWLLAM